MTLTENNEMTYNSNGDLIRKTFYNSNGKEIELDTYTYDSNGNLLEVEQDKYTNGLLLEKDYYNNSWERIKQDNYDSNGNLIENSLFTYNSSGNLLEVEQDKYTNDLLLEKDYYNGSWERIKQDNYDSNGNLIENSLFTYDSKSNLLEVEQDKYTNDLLLEKDYYNGSWERIKQDNYDSNGNLIENSLFTYDSKSNLLEVEQDKYTNSLLLEKDYYNGSWERIKQDNYDSNGNLIENSLFTYDSKSNLLEVEQDKYTNSLLLEKDYYNGSWNLIKQDNYNGNYGRNNPINILNDGNFLTNSDINNIIQQMATYAHNNNIQISSINNVISNQALMHIILSSSHS